LVDDSENSVEDMYRIHVDNMKVLGTPPHSKSFFYETLKELHSKGLVENFFAGYQGKKIAAISIFPHRDSVRWGTGVQLTEYRSLNPISLLLWEAIKWSNEQGYRSFDLGGTRPNSGTFFFKTGWIHRKFKNGRILNMDNLQFFLKGEKEIVDVREPKYERLSTLWRDFMPQFLAKQIGPYIRRQLAA